MTLLPTDLLPSLFHNQLLLYRGWLTESRDDKTQQEPQRKQSWNLQSPLPFCNTAPCLTLSASLESCYSGEKEAFMKLAQELFSVRKRECMLGNMHSIPKCINQSNSSCLKAPYI